MGESIENERIQSGKEMLLHRLNSNNSFFMVSKAQGFEKEAFHTWAHGNSICNLCALSLAFQNTGLKSYSIS